MEPLQEMPPSSWKNIRDAFKQNWPEHLIAYTFFDTQLKYPGVTAYLNLKIYCPHGDISKGAITFSDKKEGLQIMIFPLKDLQVIEECLAQTKVIDWTRPLMVEAASEDINQCLKRLSKIKQIKVLCHEKADTHFLSKENETFENLRCPADTYVSNLKPEHLDTVDKSWTYTGNWTRKFFEALMNNGLIYALYSSNDDLLAWVNISCQGALTHLFCLEPYRRKGYAEYIIKYATNSLLQSNSDVLVYTTEHNVKSKSLFKKLGFQDVGYVYWLIVEPE